jgi:3-hydroxyisobutyrate dehydrogenase-like beta-hydroxyacid dehydrogenase
VKIAFLGLGIMGSRMAANLLRAGYSLSVWNRTSGKADSLLELGAYQAASPAEAAAGADVLISMLATPEVVEQTARAFLPALRPGALWIDSSTVNPAFSRRMNQECGLQGVRMIEAPVTGSKEAAEKGQLVFLVGGKSEDLEEARPLFEKMGKAIHHIGACGMAASLKIVNNMLAAQAMLAFSEGVTLGESLGLSRQFLLDFFLSGPIVAPILNGKRAKIESGDYETDFPLKLMQKDLHLAALTAYEQGVAIPSGNLAKEIYRMAALSGLGEADFSAIFEFITPPPVEK